MSQTIKKTDLPNLKNELYSFENANCKTLNSRT